MITKILLILSPRIFLVDRMTDLPLIFIIKSNLECLLIGYLLCTTHFEQEVLFVSPDLQFHSDSPKEDVVHILYFTVEN